jgi:hypothetical protein
MLAQAGRITAIDCTGRPFSVQPSDIRQSDA